MSVIHSRAASRNSGRPGLAAAAAVTRRYGQARVRVGLERFNVLGRLRMPEAMPPPLTDRLVPDWALVTMLGVGAALDLLVWRAAPWLWLRCLVAGVAILVVLVRRRGPLGAVLVAFLGEFAFDVAARHYGVAAPPSLGHTSAGVVLIYALCRWASHRQVMIGVTAVLSLTVIGDRPDEAILARLVLTLMVWFAVAAVALAMRYRAALIDHLRYQARLEERNRLARELHDSLAHHLSAIAIQAQAARFVASSRPNQATAAIADIEGLATEAIDDMRRMVGVLRGGQTDDMAPATTLYALADPAGKPSIVLVGESDLRALPRAVGTAVFRVVQEAITNARRHSRGLHTIEIDLRTGFDEVWLRVVNDGQPAGRVGSGYGLIGMNERVTSLGGEVRTGPGPSGWIVEAVFPLVTAPR